MGPGLMPGTLFNRLNRRAFPSAQFHPTRRTFSDFFSLGTDSRFKWLILCPEIWIQD